MMVARKNNHTIQSLADGCVHDWYRFVLAYPDHLVADLLNHFDVRPGQVVLDPFVGTGTTLVECKKFGVDSIGIDANPFAAFASCVKTEWSIDLSEFYARRRVVLSYLKQALERMGQSVTYQLSFEDVQVADPSLEFYRLQVEPPVDIEAVKLLMPRGAIGDLPLQKVLLARQIIDALPDDPITDLFRLALAAVTVEKLSNLGFGPEVYVKRNKRTDADLYGHLAAKLDKIGSDLAVVQQLPHIGKASVYAADSRQLATVVQQAVDFVITSPPYPNEKDYTRTTRLELVLFQFIRNRRDLREVKDVMLRSHTRNIFKTDQDSLYVEDVPEIQALVAEIERKRLERHATSGFERLYHRVVGEYFGGMYRVLHQLQQLMPPGAKLAFVVGDQMSYFQVPIYTARLLSLIACRKLAYREVEIRLWRTRLASATRRKVEEHVLVLERC